MIRLDERMKVQSLMTSNKLIHFYRIAQNMDIEPLVKALKLPGYEEMFDKITTRQDVAGSPHHDTKTIFLRWAETPTLEAAFTEIPAMDYPAMTFFPQVKPLIDRTLDLVGGKTLGRVILTKLQPGGSIDPHPDEGAYADFYERFHIPLISDEGNKFYVQGQGYIQSVQMKPGELWWFNHKRTHWVRNDSETDRIHLIMDVQAPKYRKEREPLNEISA